MKILLQTWVTRQAKYRPDAVAVVMNENRLTYRQLEESSNRLARTLKAVGCNRGDRVSFIIPKSPAAIIAILGILKADCIYVPIDSSMPASRISKIIESCENRWILAARAMESPVR